MEVVAIIVEQLDEDGTLTVVSSHRLAWTRSFAAVSIATKNQPNSQGGWGCLRFCDRNFELAD
jgi:hypothetical protein